MRHQRTSIALRSGRPGPRRPHDRRARPPRARTPAASRLSGAASSAIAASASSTSRPATSPSSNETGDVVAVFNGELYDFADAAPRPRRARPRGAGHGRHGGHPARLRGARRRLPGRARAGCSRSRSGTGRASGSCSRATASARSRCTTSRSPTAASRSRPSSRRSCSCRASAASSTPRRSTRTSPSSTSRASETGVGGIRRLAPGHVLVWENGEIETQRYWELEPEPRELSDDEWLDLVRETVTAAVRRRLVSDVPLGALLSGGIDSTIVVGLMAQESSEPVRTFTVGVDDPRYDERAHARIAASAFGTTHEELVVEPDPVELVSAARDLPRRAARRRGDPADVPHLGGRAPARDGRAHGRRRRRVVRRVRALRGDADRAAGSAACPLLPGLGARALRALPPATATRARRLPRRAPAGDGRAARRTSATGALMEVFPAALRARALRARLAAALGAPRPPARSSARRRRRHRGLAAAGRRAPTSPTTCS